MNQLTEEKTDQPATTPTTAPEKKHNKTPKTAGAAARQQSRGADFWKQVKREFLQGKWKSVREAAEAHKISRFTLTNHHRKWTAEIKTATKLAETRTIEKTADAIAELNSRHLKNARLLQIKGIQALQAHDLESAREGAQALLDGTRLEREVLIPKGEDAQPITFILQIPRPTGEEGLKAILTKATDVTPPERPANTPGSVQEGEEAQRRIPARPQAERPQDKQPTAEDSQPEAPTDEAPPQGPGFTPANAGEEE